LASTDAAAGRERPADAIDRLRTSGWLDDADRIESPNRDARPAGMPIDLLVVHNISLPPGIYGGGAIIELFTNALDPAGHPYFAAIAGLRVSAHLLIRRDGQAIQFVPFGERAWHAGISSWAGRERCNDFSIGIELEGTDDEPFTIAQYAKLIGIAQRLQRAYPLCHAAGHSDIAPDRKTDPGPHFDWRLFRAATGLR
jgi:AmpD protein